MLRQVIRETFHRLLSRREQLALQSRSESRAVVVERAHARPWAVPQISCVIPVHNGKRDLARAVMSALGQPVAVQVVLVDDCSTDGSGELIANMAHADDRIHVVSLPRNRGQAYARNVGAAAAQAPFLTFLDQDDEHLPGWYDYALKALQGNPHLAAVKGDIELIGIPTDTSVSRGDARWRAMVNSPLWNVVMHKLVYVVLGGCPTSAEYRTREGNEDIEFMLALAYHCQLATSTYRATRHYVQPNGATAYYLRRTRIVGDQVEFIELTEAERAKDSDPVPSVRSQAAQNVRLIRELVRPLKQ